MCVLERVVASCEAGPQELKVVAQDCRLHLEHAVNKSIYRNFRDFNLMCQFQIQFVKDFLFRN